MTLFKQRRAMKACEEKEIEAEKGWGDYEGLEDGCAWNENGKFMKEENENKSANDS